MTGGDDTAHDSYHAVRTLPTRFADIDVFGHVNNAAYYSYFDTAINGWIFDLTGVSAWELPAQGVVAASACDYARELHFPEVVEIGLRVVRLGLKSITYDLGLWVTGDLEGTLRAKASWVHVYVDPSTRVTVPVPEPLRSAVNDIVGNKAGPA